VGQNSYANAVRGQVSRPQHQQAPMTFPKNQKFLPLGSNNRKLSQLQSSSTTSAAAAAITATTKASTTATTAKSPAAVFPPTTATQLAAVDQRPAMAASRANVHAI